MINALVSLVGSGFQWNIYSDFQDMLQYSFMQHAFEAGTIVAIVAGLIGYFVVIRRLSFAAHALSHIGFAGAAGAVLFGFNPLLGLFMFTSSGGVAIAFLGRKARTQDVQIGIVLSFMLGLGVLFLNLYKGYATEAYSLLFGQILGISTSNVIITLVAGIIICLLVLVLYRRLIFTALDEAVAEAKGISMLSMSLALLLLIAFATSIAVQVIGVLLIFALLVTPAAIAQRIARTPGQGIVISVCVALASTWLGLFISYYLPYPVSFFITSIVFLLYLVIRVAQAI